MKRTLIILFAALVSLTAGAQHHHGDRPGSRNGDRGHGRHHIECATGEQMNMAMQVLENQSFDDKKLDVAKLCVTLGHFCVEDLARMAAVFSFDDNRTKFLIYAYDFCPDQQNYYMLRDVFSFRSNFDTMMETVMPGYRR